jgi:hypothetical protein
MMVVVLVVCNIVTACKHNVKVEKRMEVKLDTFLTVTVDGG